MPRTLKKILLVLAVILLLPVAAGVGVAAVAYSAGTIVVEYEEGAGRTFTVPLPAGLVTTAVRFLPGEVCHEISSEVEQEIGTSPWAMVHAAALEIDAMPDGVLVQVDSHEETVRVAKEGREIVVRVLTGDERIHVSVPTRTFASVARSVEATCS